MAPVKQIAAEMLADPVIGNEPCYRRVASAGFCEYPIRLRGVGQNLATGETRVKETFAACKTRRRAKCLACSQLYERDAYSIALSGWQADASYAWITLTAPGSETFGCQHHTWAGRDGKRRCTPKRCCSGCGKDVPPCKQLHKSGDPLIGVPVCDCFDYAKASAFNASVPELWSAALAALNDVFPQPEEEHTIRRGERAGETVMRRPRLAFIKVAEWQRRGLVHIHALVRGIDDEQMARQALADVRVGEHAWSGDMTYGVKVEIIRPRCSRRARQVFSYLVKYAVKSVADHEAERSPMLRAHLERLRTAAPLCDCTAEAKEHDDHRSRCRVARARAEGLGYGGHVLTKSHRWGTSFAELRAVRRAWATANSASEWEWQWSVSSGGFAWETTEDAAAANLIYRELRQRARAPVPWRERLVWCGTIQDDPFFAEELWRDADGHVRTRAVAV